MISAQQAIQGESTCLVTPVLHVPNSINLITHPQFTSKLSSHLLHHLPKGFLPKTLSPTLPEAGIIPQAYKKLAELLTHTNLDVHCRGAQSMGARLSWQL